MGPSFLYEHIFITSSSTIAFKAYAFKCVNHSSLSFVAMRKQYGIYLLLSVNLLIKIFFSFWGFFFASSFLMTVFLFPFPFLFLFLSFFCHFYILRGFIPSISYVQFLPFGSLEWSLIPSCYHLHLRILFLSLHLPFPRSFCLEQYNPEVTASIALAELGTVLCPMFLFIYSSLFFKFLEAKIEFSVTIPASWGLVARVLKQTHR